MRKSDLEAPIETGDLGSAAIGIAGLRVFSRLAILAAVTIGAAACAPKRGPPSNANTATPAAESLDVAASRGLAYAQEACAICHAVVAGESQSPDPAAPSFEAIANTPGMTRTALRAWLRTSHPTMPNLIIDPDKIDDLSAYIASLKTSAKS